MKQLNNFDCGVAVLAKHCNNHDILKKLSPICLKRESGLSVSELVELIEILTGKIAKASKSQYLIPLIDAKIRAEIVLIRDPAKEYGHWILIKNGSVYDSELNTKSSIAAYQRNHWLIIRQIVL